MNSERSEKVREGNVAKDGISYCSKVEELGAPILECDSVNDHRIFTHQQLWPRWQIYLDLIAHKLVCCSHSRIWIQAFSIHSLVI